MKQTKARQERLEKMVAERTVYWAKKRPNWTKTAPAIIEKPLMRIRQICRQETKQEDGTVLTTMNPIYYMARDFAEIGDGRSVNLIARTLLS